MLTISNNQNNDFTMNSKFRKQRFFIKFKILSKIENEI